MIVKDKVHGVYVILIMYSSQKVVFIFNPKSIQKMYETMEKPADL